MRKRAERAGEEQAKNLVKYEAAGAVCRTVRRSSVLKVNAHGIGGDEEGFCYAG